MKRLIPALLIISLISCDTKKNSEAISSDESPEVSTAYEQVDHIILAVNDLESGIQQMKELTGVDPVIGGEHPFSFTQNALISLGNNTYIEILAPRENVDSIPEWISKLDNLTPNGWAISSRKIASTRDNVASLDFTVTDLRDGSRIKPEGDTLTWTTFGLTDVQYSYIPFFIQWGETSLHPSKSSPEGCSLKSVKIMTPDSESLSSLFKTLNLENVEVEESEESKMIFTIDSPKGEIKFSN